jgi:peptide methionine sulfoxide reductase msrA/msrB
MRTLIALSLVAVTLIGGFAMQASQPPKGETDGSQETTMKKDTRELSRAGYDIRPLSPEKVAELAKRLTPEQYRVTQRSGTEPAFCGNLLDNKKSGTYVCVVCGLPLFSSEHKFDSGTGWPSFFRPFDRDHVAYVKDESHGMTRVEIRCARCSAHLGHVFDDGPAPSGLRFCLNSAALDFVEKGQPLPAASRPVETRTAYFAGGCFWGIEHRFQQCPGVVEVSSGYMNGSVENPTYEQVCEHRTGHAEAVRVVYDPSRITFAQLARGFFLMHDPTQLNRQGPDVGDQYRTAIFTTDASQLQEANAIKASLQASPKFAGRTIVTQIEPAKTFYPAEDYHQDYVERTGRACHAVNPWPEVLGAAAKETAGSGH